MYITLLVYYRAFHLILQISCTIALESKIYQIWMSLCQSGSVAQLAECLHGKREALGWSPNRATIFSSAVTFGG